VKRSNEERLASLPGEELVYKAVDIAGFDIEGKVLSPARASELADRTLAAREVILKVGAQVMLIMVREFHSQRSPHIDPVQNMTMQFLGLVNGTVGTVRSFMTVLEAKNEEVISIAGPTQDMTEDPNLSDDDELKEILARKWPVVYFPDHDITLLLTPVVFNVINGLGKREASREQVRKALFRILEWVTMTFSIPRYR
jgi:hypothetical protein